MGKEQRVASGLGRLFGSRRRESAEERGCTSLPEGAVYVPVRTISNISGSSESDPRLWRRACRMPRLKVAETGIEAEEQQQRSGEGEADRDKKQEEEEEEESEKRHMAGNFLTTWDSPGSETREGLDCLRRREHSQRSSFQNSEGPNQGSVLLGLERRREESVIQCNRVGSGYVAREELVQMRKDMSAEIRELRQLQDKYYTALNHTLMENFHITGVLDARLDALQADRGSAVSTRMAVDARSPSVQLVWTFVDGVAAVLLFLIRLVSMLIARPHALLMRCLSRGSHAQKARAKASTRSSRKSWRLSASRDFIETSDAFFETATRRRLSYTAPVDS